MRLLLGFGVLLLEACGLDRVRGLAPEARSILGSDLEPDAQGQRYRPPVDSGW